MKKSSFDEIYQLPSRSYKQIQRGHPKEIFPEVTKFWVFWGFAGFLRWVNFSRSADPAEAGAESFNLGLAPAVPQAAGRSLLKGGVQPKNRFEGLWLYSVTMFLDFDGFSLSIIYLDVLFV